jgi:hypothetical protein
VFRSRSFRATEYDAEKQTGMAMNYSGLRFIVYEQPSQQPVLTRTQFYARRQLGTNACARIFY